LLSNPDEVSNFLYVADYTDCRFLLAEIRQRI
jgi:hypothetical protein